LEVRFDDKSRPGYGAGLGADAETEVMAPEEQYAMRGGSMMAAERRGS
jgi:hypothetical protein